MLDDLLCGVDRSKLRNDLIQATTIEFSDIADWQSDDHSAAVCAFRRHSQKPSNHEYKKPRCGCDPSRLIRLVDAAKHVPDDQVSARTFFETNFVPVCIDATVKGHEEHSLVTAYFEPELQASSTPDEEFTVPIHARPKQLVDANYAPTGTVPDDYAFAWQFDDGNFGEAPDRAAIYADALDGVADVIAWLRDPIDAFFMHVQGCARLSMTDGSVGRVNYSAKTGHPFTAIGRVLIDQGNIEASNVSMKAIADWLRANPEQARTVMSQNRSYIFFQMSTVEDPELGPVGAAKVQLTPHRSLAVDMRYHSFATPIFVDASNVNGAPYRKLMIAQDTGTAIRGPSRGDLFCGSGDKAGRFASHVASPVKFTVLCPRDEVAEYVAKWNAS
ncbi:MAG: MltA domain-containing protein [Pseudomonadota bacterium]